MIFFLYIFPGRMMTGRGYILALSREWGNGGMGEWKNGGMGEWDDYELLVIVAYGHGHSPIPY